MNKEMPCRKCCDLLPDYEWLDIENKKYVDKHTASCELCCEKMDLILGTAIYEKTGGIKMIDKIDFTDDIMKTISSEQKPASNPFLYRLLGVLVALELVVIYLSGFTVFHEGIRFLEQLYQLGSDVTLPVLDESLGLFDVTGSLSVSTESLPSNFMGILFFSGVLIAVGLFILPKKRNNSYGA